nr:hypothetical protein [Escherichia coli]
MLCPRRAVRGNVTFWLVASYFRVGLKDSCQYEQEASPSLLNKNGHATLFPVEAGGLWELDGDVLPSWARTILPRAWLQKDALQQREEHPAGPNERIWTGRRTGRRDAK